jgi:hypothetical protein
MLTQGQLTLAFLFQSLKPLTNFVKQIAPSRVHRDFSFGTA